MADEVEVPDSSAEAALAMFRSEPDATGDSTAAQPEAAAATQDQAQDVDPAAQTEPAAEPQALTEEQLAADPRYQQLSEFQDSVKPIMEQFGVTDAKELTAQLSDSQVLYDIMSGKGLPSQLLDVMAQNEGWGAERKQAVAQDLAGWLKKNGYLKDDGAVPVKGDPNFKDPLADKLTRLERQLSDRDAAARQQQVSAHQAEVFKTVETKVTEFCKQKGLADAEDVGYYLNQIASQVNGNKAIIGRIKNGNFVDVQRLFAQVYNAEVKRASKFSQAQTKANDRKAANPRIPAGGAPPAPAAQAKRPLKTSDDRIAAATELWRQP